MYKNVWTATVGVIPFNPKDRPEEEKGGYTNVLVFAKTFEEAIIGFNKGLHEMGFAIFDVDSDIQPLTERIQIAKEKNQKLGKYILEEGSLINKKNPFSIDVYNAFLSWDWGDDEDDDDEDDDD
jgi:hypothetical protein